MATKAKACNEWPILSEEEVKAKMEAGFKMWCLKSGPPYTTQEIKPPGALVRSFTCKNFQAALDFIQAGGAIAESRGHHPDFHLTSYKNVDVVIYTHSLGGITENDFNLAESLDQIPVQYSQSFLKEHPECEQSESREFYHMDYKGGHFEERVLP